MGPPKKFGKHCFKTLTICQKILCTKKINYLNIIRQRKKCELEAAGGE